VSEDKEVMKIFGLESEEVTEQFVTLHNEELHDL
jgi:hypothetical protein